ncbi:MAG: DUF1015 domain-containing protein [Bacteroidetes bacterium]|nr:MAG: DUF1015 domain-containing protein [Bacteroidota bacterium]
MTKLHPFRAIRPVRDKAHLVATRPVYTYKKSILKAKLEENPYTFIRIIHPEYNEEVKTKPNSRERFLNVRSKFEEFFDRGILIQEERAALYLYRQSTPENIFVGVIAGASVQEYEEDRIKKHEATLTSREGMFTNYLDTVGFNAEPVLLTYHGNHKIAILQEQIMSVRPEYEFSTTDEIKHELWVIPEPMEKDLQGEFEQITATYIADGHHRSASSVRLDELLRERGESYPNMAYFLACFMEEQSLRILEFNRVIKKIKGLTPEDFLKKLKADFQLEKLKKARKPKQEHEIVMNLKGTWYAIQIVKNQVNEEDPVGSLDAEILTRKILEPILGIKDLKTDSNVQFVSGNLGLEAIEEIVAKGKGEVGFVLYPCTMDQVKKVADHQMIMPPKSTWVEPKLRSGLTIYNIRE